MNNILRTLRSEEMTTVNTDRAKSSVKTRRFTAACAGMLTMVASLSANAAFVVTGGSTSPWPVPDNDFTSDLNVKGFNQMMTGAQLSVDMDGSVTFYYIAAESGYTNSFNYGSGSSISITENNDSFDWDGWDSFSVDVKANEILDFSFTSASALALTPVDNADGSNLEGLGLIAGESMSELVLTYNDNYLGFVDSDFDDMMVRAQFIPTAVPLPAAVWLFGSGLIGLIGMARRRKQ
jgi:hypothetical protein